MPFMIPHDSYWFEFAIEYFFFKIVSYYFCITDFYMFDRNNFCIDVFLHNNAIAIPLKSKYL